MRAGSRSKSPLELPRKSSVHGAWGGILLNNPKESIIELSDIFSNAPEIVTILRPIAEIEESPYGSRL